MWYHSYGGHRRKGHHGGIGSGGGAGIMVTYDRSSLRLAHLMSQSSKWVVNGTRTTSQFKTFPLMIEPPAEGVATTRAFCGVCQRDVLVEVSHDALIRPVRKAPLVSGIAALVLGVIAIATDSSVGLVAVGFVAVIGGLVAIGSARKSGFGVQISMTEPVESRLLHSVLRMKQNARQ
jgi:hypothetical protein